MKKLTFVVFAMLLGFSSTSFAQLVWFGKKMTLEKAEARWGREPFDAKRFKEGGFTVRSIMAASILRDKKQWIGKPLADVRRELGSHDGFYFSDTVPAYLLSWGDKPDDEAWQLVFLPGAEYQVKDIIIELNGS